MEVNLQINNSLFIGLFAGLSIGLYANNGRQGSYYYRKFKHCLGSLLIEEKRRENFQIEDTTIINTNKSSDNKINSNEDERAEERTELWYVENQTEHFKIELAVKSILAEDRSNFQRVQIIETEQFGRTLVMDGQSQSSIADEHIYHESLVHPAMLIGKKAPKSVFIGGGGEFATAREVLKHKSITNVIMVDIDEKACDICREQLPEWNDGAYEDPRLQVIYDDAYAYLENTNEKFDVIIMDICDPIEAGPGYKLYTSEFYNFVIEKRLNVGGILVTQSGPGAVYNAKAECFTVINKTLSSVFDVVIPYTADVPSFGSSWGFNLAISIDKSSKSEIEEIRNKILDYDIADFNQLVDDRIFGGVQKLKFLDALSFRGLVGIPKEIRKQCEEETRVMTIDNPVFMYTGN